MFSGTIAHFPPVSSLSNIPPWASLSGLQQNVLSTLHDRQRICTQCIIFSFHCLEARRILADALPVEVEHRKTHAAQLTQLRFLGQRFDKVPLESDSVSIPRPSCHIPSYLARFRRLPGLRTHQQGISSSFRVQDCPSRLSARESLHFVPPRVNVNNQMSFEFRTYVAR